MDEPNEFGQVLHKYGIEYILKSPWLEVGECKNYETWIFHLSISYNDAEELFEVVAPLLFGYGIPFKMIQNRNLINKINGLWFGNDAVGRIVVIYPRSRREARRLSRELIELTEKMKGPACSNGVRIGSILYGVDAGAEEGKNGRKFMEKLFKKNKPNTFFDIEQKYRLKRRKSIIGRYYVPVKIIQENAKGNVLLGINLRNLTFSKCVIKQAMANSFADSRNRLPVHKLIWQRQVITMLADSVPVPKILDFCKKGTDYYLIMEFIDGRSLTSIVESLLGGRSWQDIEAGCRLDILGVYKKVLGIVAKINEIGFVHRDITDSNFIVRGDGSLVILDFELAFKLREEIPAPAFSLGTFGYMSPEQRASHKPKVADDIFSLGALLLFCVTGKRPAEIIGDDISGVGERLLKLNLPPRILNMLIQCLSVDPLLRPAIVDIDRCIDSEFATLTNDSAVGSERCQMTDAISEQDNISERLIWKG